MSHRTFFDLTHPVLSGKCGKQLVRCKLCSTWITNDRKCFSHHLHRHHQEKLRPAPQHLVVCIAPLTDKIHDLVCLIVTKTLPFSIVEDPGFRSLTSTAMTREVIAAHVHRAAEIRLNELRTEVGTAGIYVVHDCWSSRARSPYLGVGFAAPSGTFLMDLIHIPEQHTAAALARRLGQVTQGFRVLGAVSDSAANAKKASPRPWTPCLAHVLQLAAGDVLRLPKIQCLTDGMMEFPRLARRRPHALGALCVERNAPMPRPVLPCRTRWGSMVAAINALTKARPSWDCIADHALHPLPGVTARHWKALENVATALSSLESATARLGGDAMNMAGAFEVIRELVDKYNVIYEVEDEEEEGIPDSSDSDASSEDPAELEVDEDASDDASTLKSVDSVDCSGLPSTDELPSLEDMRSSIRGVLKRRLAGVWRPLLAAALLDPRTKSGALHHLRDAAVLAHATQPDQVALEQAEEHLKWALQSFGLEVVQPQESFYVSPIMSFLRQAPSDASLGDAVLNQLARWSRYQPATSTFLERAFSTAGRLDSKFRARLSHRSRRALLVLAVNGMPSLKARSQPKGDLARPALQQLKLAPRGAAARRAVIARGKGREGPGVAGGAAGDSDAPAAAAAGDR